jgi:sulfate-transporting ATPase
MPRPALEPVLRGPRRERRDGASVAPPPFTAPLLPTRIDATMSGPQYIYVMKDLRKVVPPKKEILKGIWLSFYPGAKIGVVGPNGSGKSTLLRIMAGVDTDFQGEAWPAKGTKIGYLPQEPELDATLDVKGNVELGVKATRDLLKRYEEVNAAFATISSDEEMNALIEEQGKLQEKIDAVGAWELDRKLEIAMDALRLPPADADVTTLSGGERRRVALCRILLEEPDMLLLDEPTNHLDAESVAWLEQHLARFAGTIVAITHDRYFLDNVAQWILELDRGEGFPYEGNYSSWLEQKQARLAREEKQASARSKTLERELEWIRMSPRARQSKGKARISAFEELSSEAQKEQVRTAEILIPKPERLGEDVVIFDGVTKAYGDRLLMENVSFRLPRGGIVGVIGPNGAGKTTTFRMIVGQEEPDAGNITVGSTVKLSYVDQSRDSLNPDKSVWEEVSGGLDMLDFGWQEVNSRAYLSWFNFRGGEQQKKVGVLSGGERNRVHLAKLLKSGGNVMLLDEPTNDLDVDTLRALEEAMLGFPGCAVIISHDRWFLDRVATHILAFEGDSQVVWYEGNYQDYEEDRKRRLGPDALQPHRIRYRKLVR